MEFQQRNNGNANFYAKRYGKDIPSKTKGKSPSSNSFNINLLKCFLNPECLLHLEMMVLMPQTKNTMYIPW